MSLSQRDPNFDDVPEGFPVKSVKSARQHREEEIKRVQEKFDVSRAIAKRIVEKSEGAA